MTANETLRANPKFLDRLNSFLTEDEVGVLFLKALTEKAFGQIPTTHDQSNHGTIFRAGASAGGAAVLAFVQSLDPIAVAEDLAKEAANEKLKTPAELPSALIARLNRISPDKAPKFNIPQPPMTGPKIT